MVCIMHHPIVEDTMRDHDSTTTRPIDPARPSFAADPYPVYAHVRQQGAIFQQADDPLFYVTHYAQVHAIFRDKRFGSTFFHRYTPEQLNLPSNIPRWRDPRWVDFQAFERWDMLALEPPAHTQLRRLVLEAFTPRSVAALHNSIAQRARQLLAPWREHGRIDIVNDYAQHYSLGIICDLIGVNPADRDTIKALSDAVVTMYEPAASDEQQARANQAVATFATYLRAVIRMRRHHPSDDLMSALLSASIDGVRLSDEQIISTAMVLLMAGHEATVNATANGIHACICHPEQWQRIRTGEVSPRTACEEILRYDPPLQSFERWVLDPGVEIAGVPLPVGSRVALVLGAANRDPQRWPDADRFDVGRGDANHMSFGGGIHFCIGAPLARLELTCTLAELARTQTELVAVGAAVRTPMYQFRGFKSLEIGLHGER